MTILEEVRHSLIIIEHDPMLYEDAQGMIEFLPRFARYCKSPALLTWNRYLLENLTKNAVRVFYFDEGPRATAKLISKAYPKAQKSQTTLDLRRPAYNRNPGRLQPPRDPNPDCKRATSGIQARHCYYRDRRCTKRIQADLETEICPLRTLPSLE
jgi:hypothetical protein